MNRPDSALDSKELGYNRATWLRGVGTAVFVPENFEPGYRYPVVVWLEGSTAGFEAKTWFPLISPRNALAISLRPPHSGQDGWGTSQEDLWQALEYVGESVTEVAAEVAVHPRRIFLAGRADGAAMAANILRTSPERFAGAILIEPATDASPISRHLQRSGPASPVLVISHEAEIREFRKHYGSELNIETVSGSSKSALARSINRWLMAQIESATEVRAKGSR